MNREETPRSQESGRKCARPVPGRRLNPVAHVFISLSQNEYNSRTYSGTVLGNQTVGNYILVAQGSANVGGFPILFDVQ